MVTCDCYMNLLVREMGLSESTQKKDSMKIPWFIMVSHHVPQIFIDVGHLGGFSHHFSDIHAEKNTRAALRRHFGQLSEGATSVGGAIFGWRLDNVGHVYV